MVETTENARLAAPAPLTPALRPLSSGYRAYAMVLLVSIYAFNYLDRQVISILAEPIKNELGLRDWQLGLVSGLAFALFYSFLGIPIARLAERRNRAWIIAISAAVWSAFTAVCGLTQTAMQLVLARIGVGVGEAGCNPPAQSLVVDYASKEKRASALGIYASGGSFGVLLGMGFGGVIADAYGWRAAFFIAGLPGLVLAVLAALTLVEPRRSAPALSPAAQTSFRDAMGFLWSKPTYRLLLFAAATKSFATYGAGPFLASYFLRLHRPEVETLAGRLGAVLGFNLQPVGFLGIMLGLSAGVAGVIGTWAGGMLVDRLAPRDKRFYLWIPAVSAALTVPLQATAVLVGSVPLALAFITLNNFVMLFWPGPAYGVTHSIAPPHMRATAVAVLLFMMNLIGLGLGPVTIGAVSDFFGGPLGMGSGEGLRWAIICSVSGSVIAAGLFAWAARTVREDIAS
jgi:MFS family permease